MTRTERLLRLAKLRGDRAAVAILEGVKRPNQWTLPPKRHRTDWTEAELRAAWGDR